MEYAAPNPSADWLGQQMMVHDITGDVISSTRTEIIAAMVTLLRPKPVFLNSDSMAMLGRALSIVNRTRNQVRARPWSLVKDGDLWRDFEIIMRWRHWGAHTWMGWCKGHATRDMVQAGVTTEHQRRGNSHADSVADRAHKWQESIVFIMKEMGERHMCLTRVATVVCEMIASICDAAADVRDGMKRQRELHLQLGTNDDSIVLQLSQACADRYVKLPFLAC